MYYLIVMAAVIYFAPPYVVKWLAAQLGAKYSLASNGWRAGALVSIVSVIIIYSFWQNTATNFALHMIGGGVASSLVFIYIKRSLNLRVTLPIELVLLFAFVSMLGVLNEIAEYAMDTLRLSEFSFDRKDTWRDLVANTVGAFTGWMAARAFLKFRR